MDKHKLDLFVKAGFIDQPTADLLLTLSPMTSVPAESGLTEADVEQAIQAWDAALPAYAGLLEPGAV